jgi:hypothetical protein
MDSLTSPPQRELYRCICFCAMPTASPVPPAVSSEEWEFLEWNVLKPSRSSSVCITCQHFRYEVGKHCATLLTCPIHQGLILQGEHLTKRCAQWVARQEVAVGWCPEGG